MNLIEHQILHRASQNKNKTIENLESSLVKSKLIIGDNSYVRSTINKLIDQKDIIMSGSKISIVRPVADYDGMVKNSLNTIETTIGRKIKKFSINCAYGDPTILFHIEGSDNPGMFSSELIGDTLTENLIGKDIPTIFELLNDLDQKEVSNFLSIVESSL